MKIKLKCIFAAVCALAILSSCSAAADISTESKTSEQISAVSQQSTEKTDESHTSDKAVSEPEKEISENLSSAALPEESSKPESSSKSSEPKESISDTEESVQSEAERSADNGDDIIPSPGLSDELCAEHGLTVIKNPKGKTPRNIYFAEKNGEPTTFNLMREAIDYAIECSRSFEYFKWIMKNQGYVLNLNPKHRYWTIRSVNSKKAVRMYRLGEEYCNEAIRRRIYTNKDEHWRNSGKYEYELKQMKLFQPKRLFFRGSLKKVKRHTGIYATYLHYLYLMGKLPKWNQRRPLTPEMREAWRRLDRFSRQVTLVAHKNLNTLDDVQSFITKTDQDIREVTELRQKLYNKMRRCDNDERLSELKQSRDDCTTLLRQLRKEKRTAETIIEDEPKIKENIRIEMQAQNLARGIKPKTISKQRSYER